MDELNFILTADDCRDRARRFFALAVAEDDLQQREILLQMGERWMQRWRFWTPDLALPHHDRQALRA